jgi:lipopolysaccharide export system protein LptA
MTRAFAAAVCILALAGICCAAPGDSPSPPQAAGDSLKATAEQASHAAEIAREEAAGRDAALRRNEAQAVRPGDDSDAETESAAADTESAAAEETGGESGGSLIGQALAEPAEAEEAGEDEAGDDVDSAAKERREIERVEREASEGTTIIKKDAPGIAKEVEEVEEGQKKLPIVADADSVEFDREQNVITGSGNAVVRYKDAKLTADKITVYMETGDAYAEGNVSLFQDGQFLTGKTIHYNFQSGQGSIDECHAYIQPWYGYGKVVRRISEDEYQVENG